MATHAPVAEPALNVGLRSRRRFALAGGAAAYLALAVATSWSVLSLSTTRGTTCACADPSLFVWFFEWPLVALSHGTNPFYSSAMFHPEGINLLSNTSVTAWSFVLLPVTALFGPIASLNVALVAAPVLSGAAAMWTAQRWVRSSLAAFVAGGLYAFSPLVLFTGAGAHLMLTSLVVPPLAVACLDELFWRRRQPAVRVGIALGALAILQFFASTEMLVMLSVAVVASLVVLAAAAALADRRALAIAVRHGAPGLGVAAAIALAVLAWPAWYALFGPGHQVGALSLGSHPPLASVRSFVAAVPGPALWWSPTSGRFMSPSYLGPPLIATLLVGLVVFRRSLRLRAAVAIAAVLAWLTLSPMYGFGVWHYVHRIPILDDVVNIRFSALLFLPVGLALAVVLDEVLHRRRDALGVALALLIGAACVTPFALNAANGLPYHASAVWEPLWYQRNVDRLAPGQVILGFPLFNTSEDLLSVQALHGMHYAVVGGSGPDANFEGQGREGLAYRLLERLSSSGFASTPPIWRNQREDVLAALKAWGVTYVVVTVARGPGTLNVARPPAVVAAWFRTLLGPPRLEDGAWVWHLARRPAAS